MSPAYSITKVFVNLVLWVVKTVLTYPPAKSVLKALASRIQLNAM